MKAVVFERFGGPEVLEARELPDPEPKPGEVVVRVRGCGINHLDLWVRQGLAGLDPEMPHVLGNDVVGEVLEAGAGVTTPAVGDRVWVHPALSCGECPACAAGNDNLCRHYDVLGRRRNGGYAERVAVPAVNCLPYPGELPFEQAAAMPLVFLTAWHMLVGRANIAAGEDCLVIGAGSGVGSAAIQVAKLHGARVIATAGSAAKLERARALGADATIDHSQQDIAAVVRKLTDRKGAEVVIEHVGGRIFEIGLERQNLRHVGRNESRDARLLAPHLRGPHAVARDADNAAVLAEEIKRLHGFLGQADDSFGGEHGASYTVQADSSSAPPVAVT